MSVDSHDPQAPKGPSDSHHGSIGDVVDERYQLLSVLGRGTWSVVYAAESLRTGQPVALKMLLRGLPCGDDHAEQRFFREAKVTAGLRHPNTLRVFDVGRTSGGALYIASERLEGLSLEEELHIRAQRKRPMSESEALEIIDATLRSLAEAHAQNLVHRDLKPDNIFLQDIAGERVVKVVDFGIAALRGHRITARGVSLGTPDYMSPEQCARQDLDGRSDLYALGVILYRALSGQVPFIGNDVFDVMNKHREAPPPDIREIVPQISEGTALIIDRALAKHPDDRFADARAMLQVVARAARDLPVALQFRPASSGSIPRPVITRAPSATTGSWRVSAADEVTAATQRAPQVAGRVRTTTKYAQVTAEAIAAYQNRGPALDSPAARSAPSAQAGQAVPTPGDASSVIDGQPHSSPAYGRWVTAIGVVALVLWLVVG
ncbi:MAG TPA: hypothetical protein DCQ06_07625 [Myxococcales bacterium]|nr:hypothetical protein [Myxococcales bacterium]